MKTNTYMNIYLFKNENEHLHDLQHMINLFTFIPTSWLQAVALFKPMQGLICQNFYTNKPTMWITVKHMSNLCKKSLYTKKSKYMYTPWFA